MEIKEKRKLEMEVVWRRSESIKSRSAVRQTLISIVEKFIDGRSDSLAQLSL